MGILGVISAPTMWIFERLKRTSPGKARAKTPTMVGYRIGTGWKDAHEGGDGETAVYGGTLCPRSTPTEVGRRLRGQGVRLLGPGPAGETPTEVGRCLRAATGEPQPDQHQRETPTEVGRCLRGHGCSLACCQHSGRKTPTKVGRWLRRGRGDQFDVIGREKPPPKWGVLCEWT